MIWVARRCTGDIVTVSLSLKAGLCCRCIPTEETHHIIWVSACQSAAGCWTQTHDKKRESQEVAMDGITSSQSNWILYSGSRVSVTGKNSATYSLLSLKIILLYRAKPMTLLSLCYTSPDFSDHKYLFILLILATSSLKLSINPAGSAQQLFKSTRF